MQSQGSKIPPHGNGAEFLEREEFGGSHQARGDLIGPPASNLGAEPCWIVWRGYSCPRLTAKSTRGISPAPATSTSTFRRQWANPPSRKPKCGGRSPTLPRSATTGNIADSRSMAALAVKVVFPSRARPLARDLRHGSKAWKQQEPANGRSDSSCLGIVGAARSRPSGRLSPLALVALVPLRISSQPPPGAQQARRFRLGGRNHKCRDGSIRPGVPSAARFCTRWGGRPAGRARLGAGGRAGL